MRGLEVRRRENGGEKGDVCGEEWSAGGDNRRGVTGGSRQI